MKTELINFRKLSFDYANLLYGILPINGTTKIKGVDVDSFKYKFLDYSKDIIEISINYKTYNSETESYVFSICFFNSDSHIKYTNDNNSLSIGGETSVSDNIVNTDILSKFYKEAKRYYNQLEKDIPKYLRIEEEEERLKKLMDDADKLAKKIEMMKSKL